MTIRLSAALMQYAWNVGSVAEALTGGIMRIYTGSAPIAPEYAPTGTLLATLTLDGSAHTSEVAATGAIQFTGTGTTTVTSITVGGVELLLESVTGDDNILLLQEVLFGIQRASHRHDFIAEWNGESDSITLRCRPGRGTKHNGATVTGSKSGTVTLSYTNMSGGVASSKGLLFGNSQPATYDYDPPYPRARLLTAMPGGVYWSGTAVAAGTAGWFRISGPFEDDDTADTTLSRFRLDGSIGVSGANMTMSDPDISIGEEIEVASFSVSSNPNMFMG